MRDQLVDTLYTLKDDLARTEFDAVPFINANGYHSKTIAYSFWHIARIEDIIRVANEPIYVLFPGVSRDSGRRS